jgi:DNA-binding transcriptional LysR family regulator
MTEDLRRLRHLIGLAEHRNFGRAAAALYITQPALSRSIQALEAELGARLVDRRPSGVELTDIGTLVLRHATALEAASRDLDREVRLAKGLELGELHVGAGPWGGAALVAPVIGQLNRLHPRVRVHVVVAPWRELPARLGARDVDIVVGGLGEIEGLDDLDCVVLSEQEVVVVGRVGHPLAGADHLSPADLFAHPLVGPGMDSDTADLLVALARAGGGGGAATPAAADLLTVQCDSSDVLRRLLVESDAVSFMPRFLVDADVRAGRLTVIADAGLGLRVKFGAAWLRGRSIGRAGTTFLDLLRDQGETVTT